MAYLRYSRKCEWYVFETGDRILAVWHLDHRKDGPSFSESDVREMVSAKDFSRIPGYRQEHEVQLRGAFEEWLHDIEKDAI